MYNESPIQLNERELKVLEMLRDGKTNPEIAREVQVSVHTVKANLSKLFSKLGVKDRTQAVIKAIKENIIEI